MTPILGIVSSSMKGAPGVPTIGTATDVGTGRAYNNGSATVAFTAGAGPTATSFTATASGFYFVLISQSNCTASSPCTQINVSGQSAFEENVIIIYPNPNKGHFIIDFGSEMLIHDLRIYNLAGQEVQANYQIDNLKVAVNFSAASGIYFLKSKTLNTVYKIIKID